MDDANTWSYIEIPQFHERVRALLDNISDISLPNNYIDLPEKAPFAEKYAKKKVALWAELSGENLEMFQTAIVYKTASLFESLVSSKAIKKKELPTISLEYFERADITFNGKTLGQLADDLLNELAGNEGADFIGFMVTRGRCC